LVLYGFLLCRPLNLDKPWIQTLDGDFINLLCVLNPSTSLPHFGMQSMQLILYQLINSTILWSLHTLVRVLHFPNRFEGIVLVARQRFAITHKQLRQVRTQADLSVLWNYL
jgi:hypothetical protein